MSSENSGFLCLLAQLCCYPCGLQPQLLTQLPKFNAQGSESNLFSSQQLRQKSQVSLWLDQLEPICLARGGFQALIDQDQTTSFLWGLIKIGRGEIIQEADWTVSGDYCQENSKDCWSQKQQMSPVPSGILTSICFLQGICLLPRASQLGPSMVHVKWACLKWPPGTSCCYGQQPWWKAPEGTYTLLTGFLALPRTSWNPTTVSGCEAISINNAHIIHPVYKVNVPGGFRMFYLYFLVWAFISSLSSDQTLWA